MTRCLSCHSIVSKSDLVCYGCGDRVPKRTKLELKAKPVSTVSTIVFFASLGLTAYSFFADQKLPFSVSLAVSASLLLVRIIADRVANKGWSLRQN